MSRGLKVVLVSVLILLLIALGATLGYFLMQNGNWVVVRFPTAQLDIEEPFPTVEYESPLAVVMAGAMAAGFLLAVVLFLPSWARRLWERRRDRRFIDNLEGEITDLRNLPVEHPTPLEDLDEPGDGPRAPRGPLKKRSDDDDDALLAAALREADEEGR